MPTGIEVTVDGDSTSAALTLKTMDGTDRALTIKLAKTPTGSLVTFNAEGDEYTISLPTADDIAAFLRMGLLTFMPGYHLVKTN